MIRRMGPALCGVLLAVIPGVVLAGEGAAVSEPDRVEGWRLLAAGDVASATEIFRGSVEREARTGLAASLMASPTRTAAGLEQARVLLADLIAEGVDDDWSIMAEYLLARWYQVHAIELDPAEAERRLEALLEARAGHPWADQAAPKLAIVRLAEGLDAREFSRRADELERLLERVRDPAARRDTRLVIADAGLRHGGDPERVWRHYQALMAEADALRPALRARVLFQAAESAAAMGLREQAVGAYWRFAAEFPRDARVSEARRREQALADLSP